MSAPVKTEQSTQPLPIPGTERLPGRHSDFKESGLWLFPGGPLAGIGAGLLIRQFIAVDADTQFQFVVVLLVLLFVVALGTFALPKVVGRGQDGRS